MDTLPLATKADRQHALTLLEGLYRDCEIPADKKPFLTDLAHSLGPYLGVETPEGQTHYLLDASGQIASLGAGFNALPLMGTAQRQESWGNDVQGAFSETHAAFTSLLKRKAQWEEGELFFAHSGAEAIEMALGPCYRDRYCSKATKVLAFEGGFHGRTLISLASTWNKQKRLPFALPGVDMAFAPYPEIDSPPLNRPFPQGWREFWDQAPLDSPPPSSWGDDLKDDLDALLAVRSHLKTQKIFAILIEPMQCEGGDRYSSDRFHTGLLLMAKSFHIPVIYDEIQTGFHLGRTFFWHSQFNLTAFGGPLSPDYIVCAKKAQSALVLAPPKTSLKREQGHAPSVLRGYFQGMAMDQATSLILKIEREVSVALKDFVECYSSFLTRPRGLGLAFAFDMIHAKDLEPFVQQRFDYGLLFYPAGAKTLRFRLSISFTTKDIQNLFHHLRHLADHVFLQRPQPLKSFKTPNRWTDNTLTWQHLLLTFKFKAWRGQLPPFKEIFSLIKSTLSLKKNERLVLLDKDSYPTFCEGIQELQRKTYEASRQTKEEYFKEAVEHPEGICLIIETEGQIKAMTFSSPLQEHPLQKGARLDPDFYKGDSLYCLDTTIDPKEKGRKLGLQLKYALTLLAMGKGVKKIKGRNRDQLAAPMLSINLSLGGVEQFHLREDYLDFEKSRDVMYYSLPLSWAAPPLSMSKRRESPLATFDLTEKALTSRFPVLINKVCLSNFVGRSFLSHLKDMMKELPLSLRHLYTASGPSESVDKIFKSLWHHSPRPLSFLTFEGHSFGAGTFLSRALNGESSPFFKVTRLPHPQEENSEQLLKTVQDHLTHSECSSLWLEPVRQKDLSSVPFDFLKKLKRLAQEKKVPLIYNETSSQTFTYDDSHYFCSQHPDLTPSGMFFSLGGQAAIAALNKDIFVEKPLTMISTWDGDEFSLAQYHQAMQDILQNPSLFFKTRKECHKVLETLLKALPVAFTLKNARGLVRGPLPNALRSLFRREGPHFVIDPSYGEMKQWRKLLH